MNAIWAIYFEKQKFLEIDILTVEREFKVLHEDNLFANKTKKCFQ